MVGSAVVHFIFNEVRPFIFWGLGFQGLLSGTATLIWAKRLTIKDAPNPTASLDDLNNCFADDVNNAMYTLDWVFKGVCVTIEPNPWGYLNIPGLVILVLVAISLICHMFHFQRQMIGKRGPGQPAVLGYQNGFYFWYTDSMRKKKWYRAACNLIIVFTAIALVYIAYIGFTTSDIVYDFLTGQFVNVVLTAIGAAGLADPMDPPFCVHTLDFHRIRFKRGWLELVNQDNSTFAQALAQAVYYGKFGDTSYIEAIVDLKGSNLSSWEEVFEILDPVHKASKDGDPCTKSAASDNTVTGYQLLS